MDFVEGRRATSPATSELESRGRKWARLALGAIYGAAGVLHLSVPRPFVDITPAWVPHPEAVIAVTGVCELLGAIGLLQTRSLAVRRWAGWGLAAYALCVWPANFHHMQIDMARPGHGLGLGYHIPRLAAQPLIIAWALWASGALARVKRQA